jgi:ubiquinone/menaquinone biosynthesis C-methylase UbiE
MGIQEGLHFLDIGCGTGFAIAEAARKVGGHGQFFGIDLSTKMIEQAKRKFDGIGNFTFIESNAESIPLESNFFDVIICTNSFHHYYHPQKALGEMYRLLKNSGKVYILDPTNDGLLMKIMERFMKFGPEHAKLYSSREFESLYVQTGFRYLGHFPDVKFNIGTKVHIGEK